MLQEYAELDDDASIEGEEIMATFYFTFLAGCMPSYAFDRLQKTIADVIEALESDALPFGWIHVSEVDKPPLLRSLKAWQSELVSFLGTPEVLKLVTFGNKQSYHQQAAMFGHPPIVAPKGCEKEKSMFLDTGVVLPPDSLLHKYEEPLSKLLEKAKAGRTATSQLKNIESYLCRNWKTNVTVLDLDWHKKNMALVDVAHDPFEIADNMYMKSGVKPPSSPSRLYDYMTPFLVDTALVIRHLKGRMMVEFIPGEVTAVAEEIRYGLRDRPQRFPRTYDRVHLSNVPGKIYTWKWLHFT